MVRKRPSTSVSARIGGVPTTSTIAPVIGRPVVPSTTTPAMRPVPWAACCPLTCVTAARITALTSAALGQYRTKAFDLYMVDARGATPYASANRHQLFALITSCGAAPILRSVFAHQQSRAVTPLYRSCYTHRDSQ